MNSDPLEKSPVKQVQRHIFTPVPGSICTCQTQEGILCDWASYNHDLCKTNNQSEQPLYLCDQCVHWRCHTCQRSLCKKCYLDIRQTDSSHDYGVEVCWACKSFQEDGKKI